MISKVQDLLIKRTFQANYVLIRNLAINTILYHGVLLLEFIQILFYIFYRLEIVNEFTTPSPETAKATFLAQLEKGLTTTKLEEYTYDDVVQSFTIYQYFKFINFPLLILENNQSADNFLALLLILNGIFFGFLGSLLLSAELLFKQNKNGELKEGTKIVIKIFSLLNVAFLTILQIPMVAANLQPYMCGESLDDIYALNLQCGSGTHQFMLALSTITLIFYLAFLIYQRILFTSRNFETLIPWGSLERNLDLLKIGFKIILSLGFVLDKEGTTQSYVNLLCGIICVVVLYQRITRAIIFNITVYYATIFQETLLVWLFITISAHNLSGTVLYTSTILLIGAMGIFFSTYLVLFQRQNHFHRLSNYLSSRQTSNYIPINALNTKSNKKRGAHDQERYFLKLFELINSSQDDNLQSILIYRGVVANHVENCMNQKCLCRALAAKLNGIKIQKKAKDSTQFVIGNGSSSKSLQMQKIVSGALLQKSEQSSTLIGNLKKSETTTNQANPKTDHTAVQVKPSQQYLIKRLASALKKRDIISASIYNREIAQHSQDIEEENKVTFESNPKIEHFMKDEPAYPKITDMHKTFNQSSTKQSSASQDFSAYGGEQNNSLPNEEIVIEEDDGLLEFKNGKLLKYQYQFLALMIQEAINENPKNADLKILVSHIQRVKLNNEFKAIFELMNCEQCEPSLAEKYMIFMRRVDIEQQLIRQADRNANLLSGNLDIKIIYRYERLFQQYSLLEYVTANSALCFWKELMQKTIDAQAMQIKGMEISRNYALIQGVANQLQNIYPNEIKFLHRYGLFLKQIVNNEYDALAYFEKACTTYQTKIQRKNNQVAINEQTLFAENTASAIVIISSTTNELGTIIHTNQQISHLLGFSPKDLLGQNVNAIIPRQIGKAHDWFIQRYFQTNKSRIMDSKLVQFAQTEANYLKPIQLIIKVFPQLNDKIVFVGFLQNSYSYDIMKPPKAEFENKEYAYIMTDQKGNIMNVTEMLNQELGLNSKFFQQLDNQFHSQISMSLICPEIMDEDTQDLLENEGTILTFDTRDILSFVELESLTSEEILEVRSKLSIFQAYVQLQKIEYDKERCHLSIYRVLVLQNDIDQQNPNSTLKKNEQNEGIEQTESQAMRNYNSGEFNSRANGDDDDIDMASVSSAATNYNSFNKMIQDFKKALGERKTPRNLVYLNRMIILIFILSIFLSTYDFTVQQSFISQVSLESDFSLQSEKRSIEIIQLSSNIRSLVNIANNVESNNFEGETLQKINRFNYLSRLIQNQGISLKETHDFISQLRKNSNQLGNAAKQEMNIVTLHKIDLSNKIYHYDLPFRIALNSYLNFIQLLNGTLQSDLVLPGNSLIRGDPYDNQIFNETNQMQKGVSFLLLNGLRSMREMTMDSNYLMFETTDFQSQSKYISILVVGLLISFASIAMVLCQIMITDRNKGDILSLYSALSMQEIKRIYDKCDLYLDTLIIAGGVHCKNSNLPKTASRQYSINEEVKQRINDAAGNRQNEHESQLSEEEKEENHFNQFMMRKRFMRNNYGNNMRGSGGHLIHRNANFPGQDFYSEIIRHAINQMKEISEREQTIQGQYLSNYTFNPSLTNRAQHRDGSLNKVQVDNEEVDSTEREFINQDSTSPIVRQKKHHRVLRFEARGSSKEVGSSELGGGMELHSSDSDGQSNQGEGRIINRPPLRLTTLKRQNAKVIESTQNIEETNKIAELREEEIEHRRTLFMQSVNSSKNWRFLGINAFFGLLFASYFVFSFLFHQGQSQQLIDIRETIPVMFDRYSDMMLSYAFLRERILNNNSLSSFKSEDLDYHFKEQSLKMEKYISQIKISSPAGITPLYQFVMVTDSQQFCANVIGEFAGNIEEKVVVTRNMEKKLKDIKRKAYQTQLSTVIAACNAASAGDLGSLKKLKEQGVDLNMGDYDKRTPLHVGTGGGHMHIVKFLIESGVIISPVDRWGATPLNDAQPYPEIKVLLMSRGGVIGKAQPPYTAFSVTVTDDQFRLYYAAFYGDVEMMKNLRLLGWNVNGQDYDGRTAIGVASSQGNLEVVKYLVSKGADLSIKDARGNDALGDALRENRTETIEYLSSIIYESLIRDHCSKYQYGLLEKGIQQSIGIFQKRIADLQITVNRTYSYSKLLTYLNLNNISNSTNQTEDNGLTSTIPIFIATQELYLHKVIDKFVGSVQETTNLFMTNYTTATQLAFICFLLFQLLILLYLRRKLISIMREDVFQSRGILNLIPENFFEQNKDTVLKLIKKIKD